MMVEQINQTVGRLPRRVISPSRGKWRLEVGPDPLGQRIDLFRWSVDGDRVPIAFEQEVVGQNDAVTLRDRTDFVVTVGIKRHEAEALSGCPIGDLLIIAPRSRREVRRYP